MFTYISRGARRRLPLARVALFAGLAGCVGSINPANQTAPNGAEPDPPGATPDPTSEENNAARAAVGPRPLRRLSRTELVNTLSDLLGVTAEVPSELSDVLADSGYTEGGTLSNVEAESMLEWTGRLAATSAAKVST